MRKNSVEFIRLLYLALQQAMQKCKKIRSLEEMTFHQKKQIPP